MAAAELRMPADIFEEMAGVREVIPEQSSIAAANVNVETHKTPVNESRLQSSANFLFQKADDFKEYLLKLAGLIFSEQTEQPVSKSKPKKNNTFNIKKHLQYLGIALFALSKVAPLVAEKTKQTVQFFYDLIKTIFHWVTKAVLWLMGTLSDILKWLGKQLWNIIKWLGKKIWQLTKWVLQKVGQVLKWLGKQLIKFMRLIMCSIKKLAITIWGIISKLFHRVRDKMSKKYFPKEPAAMQLTPVPEKLPTMVMVSGDYEFEMPEERAKEMPITENKGENFNGKMPNCKQQFKKTGPNQENRIWYLIKKLLIKAVQFFWRMLKKFFPVIQKAIGMVVKIIIRFTINLILSAFALAAAPIIAASLTAINAITFVTGLVSFVGGVANTIEGMSDMGDFSESDMISDDAPSSTDEMRSNKEKAMTTADWKRRLDEMEAKHMENSVAYAAVKSKYISNLILQAEQNGNIEEAKRLRKALKLPETGSFDIYSLNLSSISSFDLDKHLKEEAKRTEEKMKRYNEIAKNEIIAKDEMEELLIGSNGEPDWLLIVQRLVEGLRDRIIQICQKDLYINAVDEATKNSNKQLVTYYKFKSTWIKRRVGRAVNFVESISKFYDALDEFVGYIDNLLKPFYSLFSLKEDEEEIKITEADEDNNAKIEITQIFNNFNISLMDETKAYRETNDELNNQLHLRLLRWIDILALLKAQKIQNS